MKLPTKKIERLGRNVVYAGTGGQGVGQLIQAGFASVIPQIDAAVSAADVAACIVSVVNPIQQLVLSRWVQLPGSSPDVWGGIFCGKSGDDFWIYEVDVSGPSQFHQVFTATGSGHAVAHATLMNVMHFDVANQSLEATKAIAYRAIETTCTASAYGVGLPVQLAVISSSGIEEFLEGEENYIELTELVNLWKQLEVETLGKVAPTQLTPAVEFPTTEEFTINFPIDDGQASA
jgi:hypothetical protein